MKVKGERGSKIVGYTAISFKTYLPGKTKRGPGEKENDGYG